ECDVHTACAELLQRLFSAERHGDHKAACLKKLRETVAQIRLVIHNEHTLHLTPLSSSLTIRTPVVVTTRVI
ncbi:MAG: hypothetical protein HYZ89_07600, partial [Candidatus Omnitrophica bacterium]|nr:hypothetical protein [Candidatus Omnitrophota bacterium]